jgi:hypothetical protein
VPSPALIALAGKDPPALRRTIEARDRLTDDPEQQTEPLVQ